VRYQLRHSPVLLQLVPCGGSDRIRPKQLP
jgi:hypothetical protein